MQVARARFSLLMVKGPPMPHQSMTPTPLSSPDSGLVRPRIQDTNWWVAVSLAMEG